jgi:hypothetical protein
MSDQPSIFVSSTIRDMGDLRGALKFWLEEMGFYVQMSEYTDFDRRPEAGALDACFERIRNSDYYVLIIGDQVGMCLDQDSMLSVTRQEYRVARESFERTGRPKIIALCRDRVLTALRERRAAGSEEQVSSTLSDPKFIADFVSEVRQDDAVRDALGKGEPLPPSNFLAEFKDFRDVVDVIRSTLSLKVPLARIAAIETVRNELELNLRLLLHKYKDRPFRYTGFLRNVRRQIEITTARSDATTDLNHEQIKQASIYALSAGLPAGGFQQAALDQAITSGVLLDFNIDMDRYESSDLLDALYSLREDMRSFQARLGYLEEGGHFKWHDYWQSVRNDEGGIVSVSNHDLTMLFGVYDAQQNVYRRTLGILRFLYGHTTDIEVDLRPMSPILGNDERLNKERASAFDLRDWLTKDDVFLQDKDLSEEDENLRREMFERLVSIWDEDKVVEIARGGPDAMQSALEELRSTLSREHFLAAMAELTGILVDDLKTKDLDR